LRVERAAIEITLELVATLAAQPLELRFRLHALGDADESELAGGRGEAGARGTAARVLLDPAHEGAVDLQSVYGETTQAAERRVAGAEVVEHDAQAEVLAALNHARTLARAHQHALGEVELEHAARQPELGERCRDAFRQILERELLVREVHRDARRRQAPRAPVAHLCAHTAAEQR